MDLLHTLTTHARWMSDADRELAHPCIEQMRADLEQRGIPISFTAALRIHAIVRALLLLGRAEAALTADGFAPDCNGIAKNPAAAITCIGRAQDQLRKACKDFDDFCRRESAALAKASSASRATGRPSPAVSPLPTGEAMSAETETREAHSRAASTPIPPRTAAQPKHGPKPKLTLLKKPAAPTPAPTAPTSPTKPSAPVGADRPKYLIKQNPTGRGCLSLSDQQR